MRLLALPIGKPSRCIFESPTNGDAARSFLSGSVGLHQGSGIITDPTTTHPTPTTISAWTARGLSICCVHVFMAVATVVSGWQL